MLFFYFLMCGINVLIWEKYNIQYKTILNIDIYHSTIYHLFKAVFSSLIIWILIFHYCTMCFLKKNSDIKFLNPTLELYLPPFVLLLILLYLINPLKIMNFRARFYALKLIKNIVISICAPVDFVSPWATD